MSIPSNEIISQRLEHEASNLGENMGTRDIQKAALRGQIDQGIAATDVAQRTIQLERMFRQDPAAATDTLRAEALDRGVDPETYIAQNTALVRYESLA